MINELFAREMYDTIVKEGVAEYKKILNNSNDRFWYGITKIYDLLDENEKTIFCDFIKVIIIDTISHVLGIMDGKSSLSHGGTFEFEVILDNQDMGHDMQDAFLEYVETLGK